MNNLKVGDKTALLCCSNLPALAQLEETNKLIELLKDAGLEPLIFGQLNGSTSFDQTPAQKAKNLMRAYADPTVRAIFDLSGGDLANDILDLLDYDQIRKNPKPIFGYSDLTALLNAVYQKTGQPQVLYQIKNLVWDQTKLQQQNFNAWLLKQHHQLFDFSYRVLQGQKACGPVFGGNIRCLLKLAATEYMPFADDKILFLESRGGGAELTAAHINQLRQMGVFRRVQGVLLGTFTKMQQEQLQPTVEQLILQSVPSGTFVAKTEQIGHAASSKALVIGKTLYLHV